VKTTSGSILTAKMAPMIKTAGSTVGMIRRRFLTPESRKELIELARDGSAAHRLARRANALVLLDKGMSCEAVAKVLLLDDDTVRTWYRLYKEEGIKGLASFRYEATRRLVLEKSDRGNNCISASSCVCVASASFIINCRATKSGTKCSRS
jgi:Winged helix-turn helix